MSDITTATEHDEEWPIEVQFAPRTDGPHAAVRPNPILDLVHDRAVGVARQRLLVLSAKVALVPRGRGVSDARLPPREPIRSSYGNSTCLQPPHRPAGNRGRRAKTPKAMDGLGASSTPADDA